MKKLLLIALLLLQAALLYSGKCSAKSFGKVEVTPLEQTDELSAKAVEVFRRVVDEKSGGWDGTGRTLQVQLNKDDGIQEEAFRIRLSGNKALVYASEGHGFLFGLGHLLHTSSFCNGRITLGNCEGYSAPDKHVRGIYLATHFGNFYDRAPIEEVKSYIEELALWGYNSLQVWFDMHHFTGINDPAAVKCIGRLVQLLEAGKAVGMTSGLTMLANEGYKTTPRELRTSRIDWTGYYDCQICPSKAGGTEFILKLREEMLDAFAAKGIKIDNVWLWPYDQGGCNCEDCSPWGAKGYLKLTRTLSELIRKKLPGVKIVLSTWLFDFEEQDKGEWNALAEAFKNEKPWADFIMADSHTLFPRYLLSHEVPGGLPLINFPEISMYHNRPWGGYGSDVMIERFHSIYHEVSGILDGGYPYSEGKFEDINKVLYSRMYWNDSLKGTDILRDYVSYEFSAAAADKICRALLIMEKNLNYDAVNFAKHPDKPRVIQMPGTDAGAAEELKLMREADAMLPQHIRTSWRWRILFVRAELDIMLRESEGLITPEINERFGELVNISHLQDTYWVVKPPYKE